MQRRAARRERRDPDDVEGVRAALVLPASPDDREEFVVCHFEEVARGKAIGGVQDVGLAPANELLAEIDASSVPFRSVARAWRSESGGRWSPRLARRRANPLDLL